MLGLQISGSRFNDYKGREVIVHGINLSGDSKFPATPNIPSHQPDNFFDGDNVSFVGRPFSLEEADTHFARLRRFGFNTLRYLFTWEAIEHAKPAQSDKDYDEEYIDFTIKILKSAGKHGFYVFMDPHQDVWSRFSGGSGAPMWTLYACGFDPKNFFATKAALVHNTFPETAKYPRMIWPTNYYRLVSQTMFALFFAGSVYAPKARIGGQNIQYYLQGHFIRACEYLAKRISAAGLCGPVVVGWESLNEPNKGFLGYSDLREYPEDQRLKLGPTPTGFQGMLLGMGKPQSVSVWKFGWFGPTTSGSELLDPNGTLAWMSPDAEEETRYGWDRDPGWKLGECIWAQHGVWDTKLDKLLLPDYFAKASDGSPMTYIKFTDTFFMDFYSTYRTSIRGVVPDTIMFCQPPVFEVPPDLVNPKPDGSIPNQEPDTVFAPHFYDGLTLINKSWNRWMNVDVFGILRGKYRYVSMATRFGETNIRTCLREQLQAMTEEGMTRMGSRPTVFTEIGIPYDMDGKAAYKNGDYSSQVAAMDANMFALEGSGSAGYTLWTYVASNNHEWGDNWNGEDLSIFSNGDAVPSSLGLTNLRNGTGSGTAAEKGYRAAEAVVRPYPMAARGNIISYGFDLRACTWTMSVQNSSQQSYDSSETNSSIFSVDDKCDPTLIFLPELHFPKDNTIIEVSGGDCLIVEPEKPSELRHLRWTNPGGEHSIKIVGKTVLASLDGSSVPGESTPLSPTNDCGQCRVM